jgi:hypothetical protein
MKNGAYEGLQRRSRRPSGRFGVKKNRLRDGTAG